MILQGRNLIVKAGGNAIAAAKSCSIKVSVSEISVANPSNYQWKKTRIDKMSWSVSTNQLLTSLVKSYEMVGTTVTVDVCLTGDMGLAFNGFVNNVDISQNPAFGIRSVVWDKTQNKFLLKVVDRDFGTVYYYDSWTGGDTYMSPSAYDLFSYNGTTYVWLNNTLSAEKLSGQAHVVGWNITGTLGNLCQGSFEFHGNGPLSPASLPST